MGIPPKSDNAQGTDVADLEALEAELKRFVVEVLPLERVSADDIDSEQPLFNQGLDLDSVDYLDLALALHKKYGIELGEDTEENSALLASIRSLAAHIHEMAGQKKK